MRLALRRARRCVVAVNGRRAQTDLKRMFSLYARYPDDLKPIADLFKQIVTEDLLRSDALVASDTAPAAVTPATSAGDAAGGEAKKQNKEADSSAFVQRVVDLHRRYHSFVSRCFASHTRMAGALRTVCAGCMRVAHKDVARHALFDARRRRRSRVC